MAKDGTTNYTTIKDSMLSLVVMKHDWTDRVIVYLKANSFLIVNEKMTNLVLVGDGINQTVATGDLNASQYVNIWHFSQLGNLMTITMYS